MVYLNEFDPDLVKVNKRELRINGDIYYIRYGMNISQYNINSVNSLYLIVKDLVGNVEKIKGSKDRYLVIDESNKEIINVFDKLFDFIEKKIKDDNKVNFGVDAKIIGYNKLRFSSDVDLPLDRPIKFHSLIIVVNCIVCKGNKLYPEIYLDEGIFELYTI